MGCDLMGNHLARNPFLTDFRVCRAEALPFPTNSFDLATANMVFEHLSDPVAALAEIRRVLVPGGVLVAITPNRHHPMVFIASVLLTRRFRSLLGHLADHRSSDHIFPTVYTCNTLKAISSHAAKAGLEVEMLESFHSLPFAKGIPGRIEDWIGWCSNILAVLRKPS